MNTDDTFISEEEIQAYVDGQLGEERRRLIEILLESNPDAAARVEHYRNQNALLNQLYPAISDNQSEKYLAYVRGRTRQARSPLLRYVAGLLLLCSGAVIGWSLRGELPQSYTQLAENHSMVLAQDAALAHAVYQPEVLHPVEVDSNQQEHLLKWLSKRLGKSLKTPDLTSQGFSLLGGRLLPSQYGPAAQFMYQNNAGQRLTLYVVVEPEKNRQSAFRFFNSNNINVFYWTDEDFGFALSGEFDKSLLSDAANVVYKQLSL